MVVGGEGPQDGLAGVVVGPDGGGEGQESLQDRGEDALGAVPAAAFEADQRTVQVGWPSRAVRAPHGERRGAVTTRAAVSTWRQPTNKPEPYRQRGDESSPGSASTSTTRRRTGTAAATAL